MKIKVLKLHPNAVLPTKGTEMSGCYDFYCVNYIEKDEYVSYHTGIAIELPEGYDLLLFSRSSIRTQDLILANGVGYIDWDYRGEIVFSFKKLKNHSSKMYVIGDRVGQGRLIEKTNEIYEWATELSSTVRGTGGHGSTGK